MPPKEARKAFKFGAIIPERKAPAIEFGRIRTSASLATLQAAQQASPDSFDALADFGATWQWLGNDAWGDCVAVAWANQRRVVSTTLAATERYPNLDQVLQFYRTQNPRFDPASTRDRNGPGSSADGGMNVQTALDTLVRDGGPDGVRAVAFARIDASDMGQVRAALAIFGTLVVVCRAYAHNGDQTWAGQPWTGDARSTFAGSHAVLAGGYVPEVKSVTWGTTARFSEAYWTGSGGAPSARNIHDAFAVIWPEYFGTRSFMAGVDLPLLAAEYRRLTGSTLQYPMLPYNPLYYLKTTGTPSGRVEVHRTLNNSAYTDPNVQTVTPLSWAGAQPHDTLCVEREDLYVIRTGTTRTGQIELHRIPSSSRFTTVDIQQGTVFGLWESGNGAWTVDNGDLYFIKTRQPQSGRVEVHRSKHVSKFAKRDGDWVTPFGPGDADNGTWTIRHGDLFFIKTKNAQSGRIEVHRCDGEEGYANVAHYATAIGAGEGTNGTFQIGHKGDLYFIKTAHQESNRIEVHICTAASAYQDVLHYATYLDAVEGSRGFFTV